MTDLILASQSASRAALFSGAGLAFTQIGANVDEDAVKAGMRAEGKSTAEQAEVLAEMKAAKISRKHAGLVVGGDQMLDLNGTAFDKPKDLDQARDNLLKLRGKTHTLETAIVVCEGGAPVWRHIAKPKLTMRAFSDAFLDQYIDAAGPKILASVGAYQLEDLGAQLFNKIEGDYFSILGLPLLPLLDWLRDRGVLTR
ncbi:MAG: Maf family protein [Pseudomonadota bacterium]